MILAQNAYYEVPPGKLAAVVTYLEMTSPPAARPVPARPDLRLDHVERPDPAFYRDLFHRVGADWLWFSRLLMSNRELTAIIHDPLVEVHVLRAGAEGIGLLELDRRKAGEVELAYFGLVRAAVGGGAGRWLMDRAVRLAFRHAPRRLWLHTCTLDHPGALGFYIRSGFRPYARAIEIADDPRATGELPRGVAPQLPIIG